MLRELRAWCESRIVLGSGLVVALHNPNSTAGLLGFTFAMFAFFAGLAASDESCRTGHLSSFDFRDLSPEEVCGLPGKYVGCRRQ